MSDKQKRIPIPKVFTDGGLQAQPEVLQRKRKSNSLFIGIPKETTLQERRVALVPSAVASLISHGHRVVIESGAGEKSNYSDHDYSEAGADVAHSKEQVFKS
ncbi:MAG: alanine dehydrogenase, partial [Patescibacteria group bacterium]